MNQIAKIIKSRLTDPEKLGDWYYERLETCVKCPLNSENKENLSTKDKVFNLANLGETHCTLCGCSIKQKTKLKEEQCPDNPPRWKSIKPGEVSKITLENLSKDKVSLVKIHESNTHVVDYGILKYDQDTNIKLLLNTGGQKLQSLNINTSCGCTNASNEEVDKGYEIGLKYDSKREGIFNKKVNISYVNKQGASEIIKIEIKGLVKSRFKK